MKTNEVLICFCIGLLPYSIPGPRSIAKPAKHAEIPVNVRLK